MILTLLYRDLVGGFYSILALRRFCKIRLFGRSLNSLFYKISTAHGKSATF